MDLLHEIPEFREPLRAALAVLLEGWELANDAGQDPWQFAVEASELHALGFSKNGVRWLVSKGFARHAVDRTPAMGRPGRQFHVTDNLVLDARCCLVLTADGVGLARQLLGASPVAARPSLAPTATKVPPLPLPQWDARARILRYDGKIVKHFKVPAGNQELVLSAFQEEGWPRAIDDPLPPVAGLDAQRRLHDTINRLNRNQKHLLIHFSGNGSGRAVCWAPADGTAS